jgi:hypothetical protein
MHGWVQILQALRLALCTKENDCRALQGIVLSVVVTFSSSPSNAGEDQRRMLIYARVKPCATRVALNLDVA